MPPMPFPCPAPQPNQTCFLALAFPCTGTYMIFSRPKASPPIDGQLGHPLLHMQLETQLWGYWLVHIVVPPMGLQTPLAPWVLSLAPSLEALQKSLQQDSSMMGWYSILSIHQTSAVLSKSALIYFWLKSEPIVSS